MKVYYFLTVMKSKNKQFYPGDSGKRIYLPMQETQETQVRSLDQEDPLEDGMTTHSSIFAPLPWSEEPGGLQSMGSQRVGHNLGT